jgi:integrase
MARLINDMHAKGYAPATANGVLVLMRYIFNLAHKWNVPGAGVNPTTGLTLAPEVHKQRFLTDDEAERLIAAIGEEKNRAAANAIMLLLLTGARRSEVMHAKWEYVDWQKHTLLVPLSKSGRPRTIALSSEAITLLGSLRPAADTGYIFPSPVTEHGFVYLFFPWDRIRRRAGLRDVRLHDLRHSFASFLVNKGVSLYVVQALLGHTQPRTTQRYARLAQQTLLDAAEVVSAVIHGTPRVPPIAPSHPAHSNAVPEA